MGDLVVRSFLPDDPGAVHFSPQQTAQQAGFTDWLGSVRQAPDVGPAWTAEYAGRVVGCGGFALIWPGRCTAWAAVGCDIPPWAWTGITRAVASRLHQLRAIGIRRVEAETLHGYAAAARWVRLLGFTWECLSPAFGPDGRAYDRWAKVFAP